MEVFRPASLAEKNGVLCIDHSFDLTPHEA